MRPDGLFKITQKSYNAYIQTLSNLTNIDIHNTDSLMDALDKRFAFFDEAGCHVSDFGLDTYFYRNISHKDMDYIIQKGLKHEDLSIEEIAGYHTGLLKIFMKFNKKYNWVMQIHANVLRNMNLPMYEDIGADKGFDSVGTQSGIAKELLYLLMMVVFQDVFLR